MSQSATNQTLTDKNQTRHGARDHEFKLMLIMLLTPIVGLFFALLGTSRNEALADAYAYRPEVKFEYIQTAALDTPMQWDAHMFDFHDTR